MKYYSQKRRNNKNKIRKFFSFLIILIIVVSLFEGVDLYLNRNKVFPGVSAFGVQLGGLNKEEVKKTLQPITLKITDSPRVLVFEEEKIKIVPKDDLDASIDLPQAVDELYKVARSGNIFKRLRERIVVWRKGYEIPLQAEFNSQKLKDLQNKVSSLINRIPCDAYLDNNRIVESRAGVKLNLEEFDKEILETLSCWDENKYLINIPVITIPPQYTTQDLLKKLGIFKN